MLEQPKTILILCFSELHKDPRVYRQILTLKDSYNVIAAGWSSPQIDKVNFVQLNKTSNNKAKRIIDGFFKLKLRLFESYYWTNKNNQEAFQKLNTLDIDLILANDIESLPIAVKLSQLKNCKLIYDAHEYTPREFENSWRWRFFYQKHKTYLCKKYLPKVDVMLTVCDGIAEEYHKQFNIKPIVITNAPSFESLTPSKIDKNKIQIIHHGAAIPERNLELSIQLAEYLDPRFELTFMLVENNIYLQELKRIAKRCANINFIDPVPMPQIAETINKYDIGLFLLPPNNFNYAMALPNKFFEFIQARLMVAIGPSPEMAKYTKEYDLGIVTKTFNPEEMARELNKLTTDQIESFKANSNKCAHKLSFEMNKKHMINAVAQLLRETTCAE
ncbi:MAG: glycosyltransferase [Neisseriales bacterium]|nr:MAG: glycosyltransferase [Neisseriales bacterium]